MKARMTVVIEYDESNSFPGSFINDSMFSGYSLSEAAKSLKNAEVVHVVKGDKLSND